MLIDFHGIPERWDSDSDAERIRSALALPPVVNDAKRAQPILERNINNPRFVYRLDYWENLSESLLPSAVREQIADCELLCIVPHGPLHLLPFVALRWSPTEYLIERFGISTVPSITVLRFCQARNRSRQMWGRRPTSCFIAAVAASADNNEEDFEADGHEIAELFRMTGPERRITVLRGPVTNGYRAASKQNVVTAMPGHDVIHFACHGIFGLDLHGAEPLASGLLLSDGRRQSSLAGIERAAPAEREPFLLSAREILSMELNADLITLRACSSARVDVQAGDELIGLIRAFFYAGTPSLIASLWNVNKKSSQLLLRRFYEAWLRDTGRGWKWKALRAAQLELLHDGFPHPYHWAAFTLIGDWL
jgi:CHAT domain-containing protein